MDMMETVRFSKVVQASDKPVMHLLWTDPAKDATLKKAIKLARVMTLHQRSLKPMMRSGKAIVVRLRQITNRKDHEKHLMNSRHLEDEQTK